MAHISDGEQGAGSMRKKGFENGATPHWVSGGELVLDTLDIAFDVTERPASPGATVHFPFGVVNRSAEVLQCVYVVETEAGFPLKSWRVRGPSEVGAGERVRAYLDVGLLGRSVKPGRYRLRLVVRVNGSGSFVATDCFIDIRDIEPSLSLGGTPQLTLNPDGSVNVTLSLLNSSGFDIKASVDVRHVGGWHFEIDKPELTLRAQADPVEVKLTLRPPAGRSAKAGDEVVLAVSFDGHTLTVPDRLEGVGAKEEVRRRLGKVARWAVAGGGPVVAAIAILVNVLMPQSARLMVVSPGDLVQGDTRQVVTLQGEGFDDKATVRFSGAGITVHGPVRRHSERSLELIASVDRQAVPGARDVSIVNADGERAVCSRCFEVRTATIPTLAVNDPVVREGGTALFTISLSPSSSTDATVAFRTADGTGRAPADYVPVNGTLRFVPGETSKTVEVPVRRDRGAEQDETFSLDLSAPAGATLGASKGTVTILDEAAPPSLAETKGPEEASTPLDPEASTSRSPQASPSVPPGEASISLGDVTVGESDRGITKATVTVSLSQSADRPVTAAFATADGTARASEDYLPSDGTITFAPGDTSKTVEVAVRGDTLDEDNETLVVNLSSPEGAGIRDAQAVVTISDDDEAISDPSILVEDVTVNEGDKGATSATFTISLSQPADKPMTVAVATADESAKAPADYLAVKRTVTFNPGERTKTQTVAVIGDTMDEPNKTLLLKLSAPSGATLAHTQATATIVDDDPAPSLRVGDVRSVEEGATAVFTVSLSQASGKRVTLIYATQDIPRGTRWTPATANKDYVTVSRMLTFEPGQTSKVVSVPVLTRDECEDADEVFALRLSKVSEATIRDGEATAVIKGTPPCDEGGEAPTPTTQRPQDHGID